MDGKKAFRKKAKVHKTETVYKGKLFSFVTEDITLPNGARTEMAIVHHLGSTGIVPLLDDEKFVIVKQYRYSVGDYLLEIPAGTMEPGESPLNCARRELRRRQGLWEENSLNLLKCISSLSIQTKKSMYILQGALPHQNRILIKMR